MVDQEKGGFAESESGAAQLLRRREALQAQYEQLLSWVRAGAPSGDALSAAFKQLHDALLIVCDAERELRACLELIAAKDAACEAQQRRCKELLDACPDAYFVTNHAGVIREANPAAATLTGRAMERLIGTPLVDLIHSEQRAGFLLQVEELVERGRLEQVGSRIVRDDSSVASVAISATMCAVEQRWVLCDVTDAVQDKQQLREMHQTIQRSERLAAIGTLAAGLGHDVKNLLFPMRRRLESLAEAKLSAEATEDVEGLRHVVRYLQQLANNLQLMAERPDASQMMQGTTEIVTWWEHVSPLVRTATRSSVQLRARFGDGLPPLNIAPHLLTQAVMNLVSNAGEVMGDGGVITVWAEQARHGSFVPVGVSDNGPGMSAEVLRRALDPFFTTGPRSRGLSTGMGLSLVRSIVRSVAGSIRIDSRPGEGTTVVLRLPIAPEPGPGGQRIAGGTPCAAVSVRDSHLAATMCTLLNLSRLPSWRCDPMDPGDCDLWIVEPESVDVAKAQAFLHADAKRRLVLFGHKSSQWEEIKAMWIDPSASLSNLRDTLSEIAFDVLRGGERAPRS